MCCTQTGGMRIRIHHGFRTTSLAKTPTSSLANPMLRLDRAYKADFGRVVCSIRHVKGRAVWMSRNTPLP